MQISIFKAKNGKSPFIEWLEDLDKFTQSIIFTRLDRVIEGNFGDCKQIKNGQGVWELRISYGSGYRVYYGKKGDAIVVLLIGGDKKSQTRDIEKAKNYWLEVKGLL